MKKKEMKSEFTIKLRLYSLFSILVAVFIFQQEAKAKGPGYKNFCPKLPASTKKYISKKFKQDPFEFVESFFEESMNTKTRENQNNLLKVSLDLKKIYLGSFQNYKSKVLGNHLINYIRTQYFGNVKNLFQTQSKLLDIKNYDLAPHNLDKKTIQATNFKKTRCSAAERKFLKCRGSLFTIEAQKLPNLSCYSKSTQKAFSTKFYLTHSKKLGFKIVDIELSGKRVILNSLTYASKMKARGYNKNAIASQFYLFSGGGKTSFKYPKKVPHSKALTKIKEINSERIPASL